mgnify:CR=1 FL=1
MASEPITDRTIGPADVDPSALAGFQFERCVFRGCRWTGADLQGCRFTECRFESCDLSNVRLTATGLRQVSFKLLGIAFDASSDFLLAVKFEACLMDLCIFRGMRLPGTLFQGCRMRETDLSEAKLSSARFDDCDLTGAIFDRTDLEKADLRTAHGFLIDPERNRVKHARFSRQDLYGLLYRYGIVVE